MSKLSELGSILNGKTIPINHGKYPAYGGNGIIDYVDSYNYSENTIIIGRVGANCGAIHFCSSKCWVTDNALAFVVKNNDPYFVYCLLKLLNLNKFHIGSSQPLITQGIINEIETEYLKDIKVQENISKLFRIIDKKVENNKNIISELESMAKTIYDYWFLQYEFPNEEGKPYKSSGGKMFWNEELKREIPEGWEIESLSKLATFNNGINYDKDEIGDKEYKIINVRNITSSSLLINCSELDDIKLKKTQGDKYLVESNDILIARSGTPGAVRLLLSKPDDIIYCGFIIKCKPNNEKHRLLLTYYLKMLEGSNATKTGGSIMQNVSQDTLKKVKICMPSESIIKIFNDKVLTFLNKMQCLMRENEELTSLRDFLLPLLMNGQVGFKE